MKSNNKHDALLNGFIEYLNEQGIYLASGKEWNRTKVIEEYLQKIDTVAARKYTGFKTDKK